MSHTILLQREADLPDPDRIRIDQIESAARRVLELEGTPDSMVSIIIGTDSHIQDLNKQFRGIDAPTDVLSFPSDPIPEGMEDEEDEGRYLGDIIIGLAYTLRRTQEEGRNIHGELVLLVVHGTLHLLGYDHDTPEKQAVMWQRQAAALAALGVDIEVPAYIHED